MRVAKLILTGLVSLSVSVVAFAKAEKPNIIFILADDLGYGDLGVTGHPYAMSPNLDRLASEGLRIENAYVSGAWCSPSRAALMGGVYPAREFNVTHTLDYNKPSMTSVLKDAGYTTAHYGKWHIGPKREGPTPDMYGIDEAFITNGTGPTWPKEARKDPHYREKTTPHYVDLTIDFMERHQDKPFFVNLWVYPTHSYINPTKEQLAVYKDLEVEINDFENPLQREFLEFVSQHGDIQDAMRAYCADVTALDTEMGRLFDALDELGLTENTIVIFTSDNGPGPIGTEESIIRRYGERPTLLNNVGSSGPFRDRKISLNDGGTRVPFIVRWPAKIAAGRFDQSTLFGGVDLMPTLASIAGAEVPKNIDGEDLSQRLVTGEGKNRSLPLYWNDRPGWSTMRDKQWKAHLQKGEFRLFDIIKDPSESSDVSKQNPEVSDKYLRALRKWEAVLPKQKKK
ncbi:sulfatase family protein [Pelagicoccus mobilis]|uniref:Sulfatase-like hydrolase/transferase n=1 Tax=Pelagicoccus mobilis TaxID=415221 RepID=A0A934VTA2_9BACT|nr:sulfatase-like hydrolase/transferase [Pelagicoccus mobilis]MBK1879860.1 sulfatase-like hydrolase/transferase [Pelagicoccus mobilis]